MPSTPAKQPIKLIDKAQTEAMCIGLVQSALADITPRHHAELMAGYVTEMLEGRQLAQLSVPELVTLTQSMAALWTYMSELAALLTDQEVAAAVLVHGGQEIVTQLAMRIARRG